MAGSLTAGMLNRPAVLMASAFIAGSLAGLHNPSLSCSLLWASLGFSLLLLGICLICRSNCSGRVRNAAALLVLMLAGLARGVAGGYDGIEAIAEGASQVEVLEGMVDGDPEWDLGKSGRRRVHFDLLTHSGDRVKVALAGRGAGRVDYGDGIRMKGYSQAGRAGRLYFSGQLEGDGVLSRGGGSGYKRWLYGVRRESAGILDRGISDFPGEAGILKALVLGYRRGIDGDVNEDFIATGAMHIFAISGLHVGIVCGFVVFLLKAVQLPPKRWFPVLSVILIGYTVMTGASTSAMRACIMALVFYGSMFAGRKADFISALTFTALVITAYDPANLQDAGALLSFTVVGGLYLLGGAITDAVNTFREDDPFLASGLRTQRSGLISWLIGLAAVSISSWLTSAPLMMYFFGRLSLSGLVSNMIVVPFSFLIVLSGCCSLMAGQISVLFSDIFNHASLAMIILLETIIRWFANVPHTDIRGVEFSALQAWLSYAFLAGLTMLVMRLSSCRNSHRKNGVSSGCNTLQ